MRADPALSAANHHASIVTEDSAVMMSRAAELFIASITRDAWAARHGTRRTLMQSDVIAAVRASEVYDFLLDVLPVADDLPAIAAGAMDVAIAAKAVTVPVAAAASSSLDAPAEAANGGTRVDSGTSHDGAEGTVE